MSVVVDAALLDEVKSILRRDLKLGPAAVIADNMPLVGGELDLDSLDILLVISSIEKHFKFKIPNEIVGRWAFQDVSTLTRFVAENSKANANVQTAAVGSLERDWLSMLPHGDGFRMISRVYGVKPGEHASGVWMIDGSEPFFAAHFPGRPIVPGVFIIEALAQLSGIAAASESSGAARSVGGIAQVDVKFEKPVMPPAGIELQATVSRTMGALRQCNVIASVGGQPVARGSLTITLEL